MYLVGKVKAVFGGQTVAWDAILIRWTRRGAIKACPTAEHFFVKISRKAKDNATEFPMTFPKGGR